MILPVKRSNPSLSLLFPCQTQCHFTVTCILPLTHSHQPYTHAAPSHTFASKWYGYLVIPPFMTSFSADTIPRSARALRRNQVCWMEIFPCSHLPLAESLSPVLSAKSGQLQTPDHTPNPKRSWTTLLIDGQQQGEHRSIHDLPYQPWCYAQVRRRQEPLFTAAEGSVYAKPRWVLMSHIIRHVANLILHWNTTHTIYYRGH